MGASEVVLENRKYIAMSVMADEAVEVREPTNDLPLVEPLAIQRLTAALDAGDAFLAKPLVELGRIHAGEELERFFRRARRELVVVFAGDE